METATLLIQCPDTTGIIAKVSNCIFKLNGNIVRSDQHSTALKEDLFFMRLQFSFDKDSVTEAEIESKLEELSKDIKAKWQIFYSSNILKMGVLVSKDDHCLFDLLYRQRSGELKVEIPLVISNHIDVKDLVENFNIKFHHVPLTKENKIQSENEILELVKGKTDFLALARYMQILSPEFIRSYSNDIINIHHSFLPSFKGASPYKQAYDRGVKIIGATAHYVNDDVDEGPIIAQMVDRVYHKDLLDDLKRKGRNLEKITFANAIGAHINHSIIKRSNKTIVFE